MLQLRTSGLVWFLAFSRLLFSGPVQLLVFSVQSGPVVAFCLRGCEDGPFAATKTVIATTKTVFAAARIVFAAAKPFLAAATAAKTVSAGAETKVNN